MESDGHQLSSETWGQMWVQVRMNHTALSGPSHISDSIILPSVSDL